MHEKIALFRKAAYVCTIILVAVTMEPGAVFAAASQMVSKPKQNPKAGRHRKAHHVPPARGDDPKECAKRVAAAEAARTGSDEDIIVQEAEAVMHVAHVIAESMKVSICDLPRSQVHMSDDITPQIRKAADDYFDHGAERLNPLSSWATNFGALGHKFDPAKYIRLGQIDPQRNPDGNVFWRLRFAKQVAQQ